MPRALTHCGSDSWYSEFRVDSARIHAIHKRGGLLQGQRQAVQLGGDRLRHFQLNDRHPCSQQRDGFGHLHQVQVQHRAERGEPAPPRGHQDVPGNARRHRRRGDP